MSIEGDLIGGVGGQLYSKKSRPLTLSTREFYADYDEEGDNTDIEGKVLGLSQSFFDNLFELNGRIICNFTSFSAVFQSCQDGERVIHLMESCVQRNPTYGLDFRLYRESNSGPLDQQASRFTY